MSSAIDSESIKFLEEVRKGKPRRFIMLCRGASIQRLVVFKKGNPESILQRTKKEGFKGQSYIGIVEGKGQDISFKLCSGDGYDSEPGKDVFLKAFLASEADFKCHPRYEIVPQLPAVNEDDDGEESAAISTDRTAPKLERAADPNAELRQKMRVGIQKLTPSVQEFVAENPQRRQEVLGPLQVLKDFAVGDPSIDKAAATKAFAEIQKLVSGATSAKEGATGAAGQQAQKAWDDAVQAVLQQAEDLKRVIADHDGEGYQSLARNLIGTVSKRFDGRLAEACQEYDKAPNQGRQSVMGIVGEYAALVKNDEILRMLDDNPFDVKMSVRPTLAKALAEVERSIK